MKEEENKKNPNQDESEQLPNSQKLFKVDISIEGINPTEQTFDNTKDSGQSKNQIQIEIGNENINPNPNTGEDALIPIIETIEDKNNK